MTVINGQSLLLYQPIVGMEEEKKREHGVSFGLTEAGYDIRVKQDIIFNASWRGGYRNSVMVDGVATFGRFTIASAIEEFSMPSCLVGVVHDKSTWARRGLSVFNTVIEPGWKGFLTLELRYEGEGQLHIPAGAGIAQVLFHYLATDAQYAGKYHNQADRPVAAIMEKG